ncbi:MAG TPA: hypothetical protein VHN18_04480 [Micromonosporaceae bacterium]|nr:hypothetical protein [Micromonosporaceae bacterium]
MDSAAVGAFGGAEVDRFERLVPALRLLWQPLDDPSASERR